MQIQNPILFNFIDTINPINPTQFGDLFMKFHGIYFAFNGICSVTVVPLLFETQAIFAPIANARFF